MFSNTKNEITSTKPISHKSVTMSPWGHLAHSSIGCKILKNVQHLDLYWHFKIFSIIKISTSETHVRHDERLSTYLRCEQNNCSCRQNIIIQLRSNVHHYNNIVLNRYYVTAL